MIPNFPHAAIELTNDPSFDGKRQRRSIQRKTVDFYAPVLRQMTCKRSILQPLDSFVANLLPPFSGKFVNQTTAITTKFIHSAMNKQRCPINCVKWTPDGRRLITGSSNGEFTLWNGLTFNFETILQAHDTAIRSMVWSHNDIWFITSDDGGIIKYWQSNMNNLKAFQGHKDIIRDLSFSPSDAKFASASDDGTIGIWNFIDATLERSLTGHGWDVKCVDWHPTKGILASGSKDNLGISIIIIVKIWDPKQGTMLTTLHGHKHSITGIEFNQNGNHLLTACRDQIIRMFDIRTMKEIMQFKGHKKEAVSIAWHPHFTDLFTSGGSDGSIMFWSTTSAESIGGMEDAHDNGAVWSLDWHPVGHMLASGSNDFSTRFWTRNRPGDAMTIDAQDMVDEEDEEVRPNLYQNMAPAASVAPDFIPGMGVGERIKEAGVDLQIEVKRQRVDNVSYSGSVSKRR